LELFSTILAQQDVPFNARDVTALADTDGQLLASGANNIVRSEVGLSHLNSINDDPLLAPLADNGGPTLTRAIPVTSPAINSGSNLFNLSNDQLGSTFSRTIGGTVDIGALELQTAPALPGDYNRDETVDAADYVLWRKTMGSGVSTFDGADGEGSGYVDQDDYPVWTENFGEELIGGSGGNRFFAELTLRIPAGSVKLISPLLYDFAPPTELSDDTVQIEAPLEPLHVGLISDDIHDKALLAVLWSWDSAARRQTGDAGV
jgi:hypothetical protein